MSPTASSALGSSHGTRALSIERVLDRHGAARSAQSDASVRGLRAIIAYRFYMNYIVANMPNEPSLGEFEQLVLLAILRLKGEAYGVSIRAEISARTGRQPASGALYTTLDRLEQKALLKSRVGEPTPQRGGRAKRYYKVTASGAAAVMRAQRAFRNMLDGLALPGDSRA